MTQKPHKGDIVRWRGRSLTVREHVSFGGRRLAVLERLGAGGEVLKVFDPRAGLGGDLRVLHRLKSDGKVREKLRVWNRLASDRYGLPEVIESHRSKQSLLVITKWIEGPTLQQYLTDARSGREPWPSPLVVTGWIRGLASDLAELHRRLGLVHGDIKPANLVLGRTRRRLSLIDLGSAFRIDWAAKREPGDGVTPSYTAPELLDGEPGSAAADRFSLGAVYFELLTGSLPYDGLGGRAVCQEYRARQLVEPGRPSTRLRHAGKIPKEMLTSLDAAVLDALQHEPAERAEPERRWAQTLWDLEQSMRRNPSLSSWEERLLGWASVCVRWARRLTGTDRSGPS